jgi:hypothetical protein
MAPANESRPADMSAKVKELSESVAKAAEMAAQTKAKRNAIDAKWKGMHTGDASSSSVSLRASATSASLKAFVEEISHTEPDAAQNVKMQEGVVKLLEGILEVQKAKIEGALYGTQQLSNLKGIVEQAVPELEVSEQHPKSGRRRKQGEQRKGDTRTAAARTRGTSPQSGGVSGQSLPSRSRPTQGVPNQ